MATGTIQSTTARRSTLRAETREGGRAQIRKLIEAELMRLAPGDPLPPVRRLMQSHKVSLARLQKILGEMQAEGLIERRARLGNFKASETNASRLHPFVDLVTVGNDPRLRPYHGSIVEALAERLGKRGQGLRLHRLCAERLPADAEALASRSDVRSCILLSLPAAVANAVFARAPISVVCLLPMNDPQTYACPCITTSTQVTQLQLEHLWARGHRSIGFLDRYSDDHPVWSFMLRREAYYRLMAQRGLRVAPHWVVPVGAHDDQILAALKQMFRSDPSPTAVIVSDVQLALTYRFMASRGLQVGRDIAVVGTDDLPEALAMHPPATTVRLSREDPAQMALDALSRLWQGEQVEQVQAMTPQLVLRSSTASAQT